MAALVSKRNLPLAVRMYHLAGLCMNATACTKNCQPTGIIRKSYCKVYNNAHINVETYNSHCKVCTRTYITDHRYKTSSLLIINENCARITIQHWVFRSSTRALNTCLCVHDRDDHNKKNSINNRVFMRIVRRTYQIIIIIIRNKKKLTVIHARDDDRCT